MRMIFIVFSRQEKSLVITAKDGRGDIIHKQNDQIVGSLLERDAFAMNRLDRAVTRNRLMPTQEPSSNLHLPHLEAVIYDRLMTAWQL